jgi:hypothetical protein
MDKISKRATIVSWENDGEIFRVRYKQDDGQTVVAIVERIGWARPPAEEMVKIMAAIKAGPKTIVGKPRRPSKET